MDPYFLGCVSLIALAGCVLLETGEHHDSDEKRAVKHDYGDYYSDTGAASITSMGSTTTNTTCPLPPNTKWCKARLGNKTFNMAVRDSDDIVSKHVCETGEWELSEADVTNLGEPGHAVDIGANLGVYSLTLASAGWNVTAFEALASNVACIEASLCENPALKDKITLNKFGLSSKNERCIMVSPSFNVANGESKCGSDAVKFEKEGIPNKTKRGEFNTSRLDDVLAKQNVKEINFVKMDIEGYECEMMAGGQSLLTKYRPKFIWTEVWNKMKGCSGEDFLASFTKANYTVARDKACKEPNASTPNENQNRFMCRDD